MTNPITRVAAALLLATSLAAQARFDCAPYKISLPPQGWCLWEIVNRGGKVMLHMTSVAGIPLVSVQGTTGTIPVKLDLKEWRCYAIGPSINYGVVAAHYLPAILPLESYDSEDFVTDGVVWLQGCGMLTPLDTDCHGVGLVKPALGGIVGPWPCDWESNDALRCRDIMIDSANHPRKVGHVPVFPWYPVTVEAWFEILP